jgi:hypothetical protein
MDKAANNYLDQYVEGLKFLHELYPDYDPDFDKVRQNLLAHQNAESSETYRKVITALKRYSARRVAGEGGPAAVARRCHAVSDGFLRTWKTTDLSRAIEISITIGNIYFNGENIYPITKELLRSILTQGPKTSEKLNVHVWLTVQNMTVLDLTILPSLQRMRKYNGILTNDSTTLIWKEGDKSRFCYEPILVHNDFFSEIDDGFVVRR